MEQTNVVMAAALAASYLLGSIPFGWLLGRAAGVDLRKTGSGNIGATNVFRCVGKKLGVLAFALDALKGFAPAFFFPMAMRPGLQEAVPAWAGLACGVAAVAGHNWPVWLKFKGGKGVSTSVGMLLGVAPAAAGIGLGVFSVVVVATRWVSLASILAAVAVGGCGWWLYGAQRPPVVAATLSALVLWVVWRHRANIGRLLKGTEPKIVGKKKAG